MYVWDVCRYMCVYVRMSVCQYVYICVYMYVCGSGRGGVAVFCLILFTGAEGSSCWRLFVAGCTWGCHGDNLRCGRWREDRRRDEPSVSVLSVNSEAEWQDGRTFVAWPWPTYMYEYMFIYVSTKTVNSTTNAYTCDWNMYHMYHDNVNMVNKIVWKKRCNFFYFDILLSGNGW